MKSTTPPLGSFPPITIAPHGGECCGCWVLAADTKEQTGAWVCNECEELRELQPPGATI